MRFPRLPTRAAARGFTLIELMIVMAIIAMLAALVGPRIMTALSSSKTRTTKVQIENLTTALESFNLDVGRYPTAQEGLNALLINNPATPIPNWRGPYLKKKIMPKDAWGRDFTYQIPPQEGGQDFDLYSLGADNAKGGEGENADVVNWN